MNEPQQSPGEEVVAVESNWTGSPGLKARTAGFLYLLVVLGAVFAPFSVVPSGMMRGDAALPAIARILASRPSYVLGGAVQLMVFACDIAVALILYELLKPVSRGLALLAAFFRLVFAAVASANVLNHFAPLLLLDGAGQPGAFTPDQLQALALVVIRLRTVGFDIALFFFGLHCIVVGYLLFRSTYFPRNLGLLLAIGGLGYVANIFANAIPVVIGTKLFPYVMLPGGVAEIWLTLQLIFVGVDVPKWRAKTSASRVGGE